MRVPVPLHGVFSAPFRLFGIRPSRMNPNTCTICELMFERTLHGLRNTVLLGIIALGAAVVIIAGGIDLSSGSMVAFRLAEMDRPSTRRVSTGSMTPSSHSRALA